jgi:PAS domain S-box-containing protein
VRLDAIAAGTAGASGPGFFAALVRHLAEALGADHALVAELLPDGRLRALAGGTPRGNEAEQEWDAAGSALEGVLRAEHSCDHGLAREFPRDERARGLECALGAPLSAPDGKRLGLLWAAAAEPRRFGAEQRAAFRIFAARAAAELALRALQRTLGESEERFRDLFDEAPIAYVLEGLDTRFVRANRAALRAFEIGPEDVLGTYGKSFVADNPENQRRLKDAFDSVGRGTDTSGVVLELRRRRSGKPLWIQWWSKPDPSSGLTRTMFIDITEKVLLEQEQARLKEQNRYLREEIKSVHNFEEIVGRSPGLMGVLESVERVAATDTTVLITGETGTGKELIARAIHSHSKRHDKPLIKLNCAALPTGLVESELFGHEKGAFSGAIARRIGRFELACGGTIFLDEIGDMPPDVQVKLLRVLQEREFERVGGSATIPADVRVIAATNRDLRRLVAAEKFRQDLYFRLSVFPVHLPPLRERADDVPLLLQFFLRKFATRIGKPVEDVTPEFLQRFRAYAWPGNVRELENLVERAIILTTRSTLDVDSIPALADEPGLLRPAPASAPEARLESIEREHVLATLERTRWVIEGPSGAAGILGLHPNTLRSRMKKLGIARAGRSAQ